MWHVGDDVGIVSFKTKANTIVERSAGRHAGARSTSPRRSAPASCCGRRASRFRSAPTWRRSRRPCRRGSGASSRMSCQVPADVDAAALQPRADGRRGARHGARRRLRIHPALRSRRRRARELHRPRRGGRRPAARRRRHARKSRCARPTTWRAARAGGQQDHFPFVRTYFQTIATAKVSKSALDAKALGYLRPADVVVMHAGEVLHVALAQARALAERATGRRCRARRSPSPAAPASRRSR